MKIVFCDIDGVLNSEIGTKETGIAGIEEDKLTLAALHADGSLASVASFGR